MFCDLGHRYGQADALLQLGVAQRQNGDYTPAAESLQQALALYRDIGHRLCGQPPSSSGSPGVFGTTRSGDDSVFTASGSSPGIAT